MPDTAADCLCERLLDWGVTTIYGFPSDGTNGILGGWREASAADRPVVIDAMTEPEETPILPHISLEQMEAMTKSVLRAPREGIPGAVKAAREIAHEFLPGR